MIGTAYAVGNKTETEVVQYMEALRDDVVNVFRYRRENDVRDGELIRHDN
jgi:hypothetical protein